jgi:hypothetical protein
VLVGAAKHLLESWLKKEQQPDRLVLNNYLSMLAPRIRNIVNYDFKLPNTADRDTTVGLSAAPDLLESFLTLNNALSLAQQESSYKRESTYDNNSLGVRSSDILDNDITIDQGELDLIKILNGETASSRSSPNYVPSLANRIGNDSGIM